MHYSGGDMHPARSTEPVQRVGPTTRSGAARPVVTPAPDPSQGLPPGPSWLRMTLLLALVPLTVLPPLPGDPVTSWWPSIGVVTALLLVVPPRLLAAGVAAALLLVTVAVLLVYDLDVPTTLVAAVAVVAPAFVASRLLHGPPETTPGPAIYDARPRRYHLSLMLVALGTGLLTFGFTLSEHGPRDGALWSVTAVASTLTSLLVVLPVVVPVRDRPAVASHGERWLQRLLLAAVVPLSLVVGAFLTLAFPLLSWAGLRSTRREAHAQVFVFAVLVYALSTAGHGPLSPDRQSVMLPDAVSTLPLFVYIGALSYLMVPLARTVERLALARAHADVTASTLERMLDGANSTLLIICDAQWRITHFNEGARSILGYEPDDVVGSTPDRFHSHDDLARVAGQLGVPADWKAVVEEQVRRGTRIDHELVRGDGSRRTISLSLSAVRDADGRGLGYLATGDDVTERLRTQRALETALDREHQSVLRLQEVDHVKQELVSNVSHELRTPITSIAGYAELLADASLGELTRPQRDALQRIERNALRLQSLVDDLLTLSRAEAGRLQLARSPLDLCQVTRSSWELFDEQLRHRTLETQLTLPAQPVMVLGDRDALERVVVNLVSNAVKFTPDGGSVHVAVTRGSDGSGLLVVRDTGIGIDTDEQEKLFTRFFRSTQATDAAIQGTGLGLSIVQALVSQHGGQVAIRSRPGEGTRVTVELPSA